jgi:hypothetical protein
LLVRFGPLALEERGAKFLKIHESSNTQLEGHIDASVAPCAVEQSETRPSRRELFNRFINISVKQHLGYFARDLIGDFATFDVRISVEVVAVSDRAFSRRASVNLKPQTLFKLNLF